MDAERGTEGGILTLSALPKFSARQRLKTVGGTQTRILTPGGGSQNSSQTFLLGSAWPQYSTVQSRSAAGMFRTGALINNSVLNRDSRTAVSVCTANLSKSCEKVQSLTEIPAFLPFWREETIQNFGQFMFARAEEIARPARFSADRNSLLDLLNVAAVTVQKEGAQDYRKFSQAKDSIEKLAFEMRNIIERAGMHQEQEGVLLLALSRLCPLWPFC